jgi:hypothetical protein
LATATGTATTPAEQSAKEAALGQLEGASSSFLEASRVYNASSQQYTEDFNLVQRARTQTTASLADQLTVEEKSLAALQDQIAAQPTVNDFFVMYNDLFYDIPELGTINSHEYLIKKSSEYINLQANQEEILALQNEIAQLRTELLESQKQVIELQTGTTL